VSAGGGGSASGGSEVAARRSGSREVLVINGAKEEGKGCRATRAGVGCR